MSLITFARLAGALALTAGLAGCSDMTAEIEVQSETTGTANLPAEVFAVVDTR